MKKIKSLIIGLLCLNFFNSDLYAVDLLDNTLVEFVRFVSNSTNKNFIIDEDIESKISIILPHKFNNNDSYKVLLSILKKNNLRLMKIGDVYYIMKKNTDKYIYSKNVTFVLPDKIIPVLKKFYPKYFFAKEKKTIVFRCTKQDSISIFKLITILDKNIKSKIIKITLVSYNKDDISDSGVSLSYVSPGISWKNIINNLTSSSEVVATYSSHTINILLNYLQKNNKVNLRFSPLLRIYDGKVTSLLLGETIPFLNGTNEINGNSDVKNNNYTYKDVGSMIKINDVSITESAAYFNLNMRYEYVTNRSTTPSTSKTQINNFLKIDDGQSIIISGLSVVDESVSNYSIPYFSDIPFIGHFFIWKNAKSNIKNFSIILTSQNLPKGDPFSGE